MYRLSSRAPSFTSLTNQRRLPCPENFYLSLKTGAYLRPFADCKILSSVCFLFESIICRKLETIRRHAFSPGELAVDNPGHHGDTSLKYNYNQYIEVCLLTEMKLFTPRRRHRVPALPAM